MLLQKISILISTNFMIPSKNSYHKPHHISSITSYSCVCLGFCCCYWILFKKLHYVVLYMFYDVYLLHISYYMIYKQICILYFGCVLFRDSLQNCCGHGYSCRYNLEPSWIIHVNFRLGKNACKKILHPEFFLWFCKI